MDNRVRILVFSKDSRMFIASNVYTITNNTSVGIPIMKWTTKSNEILTVERIGYSQQKAQKYIDDGIKKQLMHGPDIYHVLNEQDEVVCCVWKPDLLEPLVIEIYYADKSHKLIIVTNTEQVFNEIKKGFDIVNEEKTSNYQNISELTICL